MSLYVGEGSKHIRPNQASEVQVVELDDPGTVDCDVEVDVIERVWVVEVLVDVVMVGLGVAPVLEVVVGSLHPNQPGVLQLVVVEVASVVVADVDVVVVVVVVDSSRQPHQPGVLQVAVRVRVLDVLEVREVVVSEPLLSKNFQLKQSTHSVSAVHAGTSSYASITFLMTPRILWFPTPTLQPLSSTVSYIQV